MSAPLRVTRRLTQAILGAAAVGAFTLTGHLALAHASATQTPSTQAQSPSDKPAAGGVPGGPSQPQVGQSQPRSGSRSGFGQTPGVQGRSSGGSGSTTTRAS